jgi:hypothetical protein
LEPDDSSCESAVVAYHHLAAIVFPEPLGGGFGYSFNIIDSVIFGNNGSPAICPEFDLGHKDFFWSFAG